MRGDGHDATHSDPMVRDSVYGQKEGCLESKLTVCTLFRLFPPFPPCIIYFSLSFSHVLFSSRPLRVKKMDWGDEDSDVGASPEEEDRR